MAMIEAGHWESRSANFNNVTAPANRLMANLGNGGMASNGSGSQKNAVALVTLPPKRCCFGNPAAKPVMPTKPSIGFYYEECSLSYYEI